jgi:hypothetical protein
MCPIVDFVQSVSFTELVVGKLRYQEVAGSASDSADSVAVGIYGGNNRNVSNHSCG